MIHDVIARWHDHMHGEPGVLEELLDDTAAPSSGRSDLTTSSETKVVPEASAPEIFSTEA